MMVSHHSSERIASPMPAPARLPPPSTKKLGPHDDRQARAPACDPAYVKAHARTRRHAALPRAGPRLPPELCQLVVDCVGEDVQEDDDARAALLCCSTVARAWATRTRRYLFRVIFLGERANDRSLLALLADPHCSIAPHVRRLEIFAGNVDWPAARDIAALLPRVEELMLDFVTLASDRGAWGAHAPGCTSIGELLGPTATVLEIRNVALTDEQHLPAFFAHFARLESLTLMHCTSVHALASSPPRCDLSHLRELNLYQGAWLVPFILSLPEVPRPQKLVMAHMEWCQVPHVNELMKIVGSALEDAEFSIYLDYGRDTNAVETHYLELSANTSLRNIAFEWAVGVSPRLTQFGLHLLRSLRAPAMDLIDICFDIADRPAPLEQEAWAGVAEIVKDARFDALGTFHVTVRAPAKQVDDAMEWIGGKLGELEDRGILDLERVEAEDD